MAAVDQLLLFHVRYLQLHRLGPHPSSLLLLLFSVLQCVFSLMLFILFILSLLLCLRMSCSCTSHNVLYPEHFLSSPSPWFSCSSGGLRYSTPTLSDLQNLQGHSSSFLFLPHLSQTHSVYSVHDNQGSAAMKRLGEPSVQAQKEKLSMSTMRDKTRNLLLRLSLPPHPRFSHPPASQHRSLWLRWRGRRTRTLRMDRIRDGERERLEGGRGTVFDKQ